MIFFLRLYFVMTGTQYIAQSGHKLIVLMRPPPEHQDNSYTPPDLHQVTLKIGNKRETEVRFCVFSDLETIISLIYYCSKF